MAIELNPIASGYSTDKINVQLQKIEDELNNNVLRRDGLSLGEANQMGVPLDMNSFDIMNVNNLDVQGFSIQGRPIDGFVQRAEDAAIAAEQDANSAATSESNAANSALYAEQQADRAEAAADSSDALVLRGDLGDSSNLAKGAALVGYDGGSVADVLPFAKIVTQDDKKFRMFAGTIRNTGSGWAFIQDGGHDPVGFNVSGVSVVDLGSRKVIRVQYDVSGTKVVTAQVTSDETLLASGIAPGASVGTGYIDIALVGRAYGNCNLSTGALSLPSHLVGTLTSVKNASGSTTISHPSNNGWVPICSPVSSSGRAVYPPAISYLSTSTEIIPQCPLSGYISYSGSAFSYSGLCNNVSVSNVSGVAVVSHPTISSSVFPSVSSRDGDRIATWDNAASANFEIKWRNFDGTQNTTPSSNSRTYFSRDALVPASLPYGVVAFDLGPIYLDPDKVVSPSGNIWMQGLIELID